MRRNSYTWSSIKQDVHTFLFYFLYLSCSHSSHTLCHPSFGLSTSSLTLLYRAQPFLSGRCPFFRVLHIGKLISFYPTSSLFGTQRQLTHPLVKSSTLPLRKILVFQGIAPWHTNCTLSCIIPHWDLATTHSPSGKEVMLSSQKDACLSGRCTLAHKFNIIRIIPLFLTQQQLTLPPVKSSSFPLWKNYVSQDLLFCNVLTYPAWYSSTLLIKSTCAFILSVFYFYSERPPLLKCFILCLVYSIAKELIHLWWNFILRVWDNKRVTSSFNWRKGRRAVIWRKKKFYLSGRNLQVGKTTQWTPRKKFRRK